LLDFSIDRVTLAKTINNHLRYYLRIKGIKPDKLITHMAILPAFGAKVIMPSFGTITDDKFCARVLILVESA
jgi:hypothetical protein|tara:strand:+ start:2649 stop:2864 length:216 start_codon:yes stop_codon:yes gene_type:complete